MTTEERQDNESMWPAVPLAYDFIEHLYDMTERRYVAADQRIGQLLLLSSTIMTASVGVAGAVKGKIAISAPFEVSIGLLALSAVVGVIGLTYGYIRILGLRSIVENSLHYSEWEFKKNALYWAVGDLDANRRLVNFKGWIIWGMSVLFIVETGFLTWWLFTQFS